MITLDTINLLLRINGLITFVLFVLVIYSKFTFKILNYLTFFLIFLQTVLVVSARYLSNSDFDPFYMYTDLCVLCDGVYEYYINFLRISFYATTIAILAPFIKNINNWFKTNWKYLFNFYYLSFYSLSIYLYNTGPVIKTNLFIYFFWICQIIVLARLVLEIRRVLLKSHI